MNSESQPDGRDSNAMLPPSTNDAEHAQLPTRVPRAMRAPSVAHEVGSEEERSMSRSSAENSLSGSFQARETNEQSRRVTGAAALLSARKQSRSAVPSSSSSSARLVASHGDDEDGADNFERRDDTASLQQQQQQQQQQSRSQDDEDDSDSDDDDFPRIPIVDAPLPAASASGTSARQLPRLPEHRAYLRPVSENSAADNSDDGNGQRRRGRRLRVGTDGELYSEAENGRESDSDIEAFRNNLLSQIRGAGGAGTNINALFEDGQEEQAEGGINPSILPAGHADNFRDEDGGMNFDRVTNASERAKKHSRLGKVLKRKLTQDDEDKCVEDDLEGFHYEVCMLPSEFRRRNRLRQRANERRMIEERRRREREALANGHGNIDTSQGRERVRQLQDLIGSETTTDASEVRSMRRAPVSRQQASSSSSSSSSSHAPINLNAESAAGDGQAALQSFIGRAPTNDDDDDGDDGGDGARASRSPKRAKLMCVVDEEASASAAPRGTGLVVDRRAARTKHLSNDIDDDHRVHVGHEEGYTHDGCLACRRGAAGQAPVPVEAMDNFVRNYVQNRGYKDEEDLAYDLEEQFEKCVRQPANRNKRDDEEQVPIFTAEDIYYHMKKHDQDPVVAMCNDLKVLDDHLEQIIHSGLYRVPKTRTLPQAYSGPAGSYMNSEERYSRIRPQDIRINEKYHKMMMDTMKMKQSIYRSKPKEMFLHNQFKAVRHDEVRPWMNPNRPVYTAANKKGTQLWANVKSKF